MTILIYAGEGVSQECLNQTKQSLHSLLPSFRYPILTIHKEYFFLPYWEKTTSLLIMPGGRDLFYHKHLQHFANERIKNYVSNGGGYLGICAGAYYGSSHVEFDKGYSLEVIGKRELAFFPGVAVGPAYGPNTFCYTTDKGVRISKVKWGSTIYPSFFKGGCYFDKACHFPSTSILAHYHDHPENHPAIISCIQGKGRVILTGVHPEYSLKGFTLSSVLEEKRKELWKKIISFLLPYRS